MDGGGFELCSPAVLETGQGELAPVVGQSFFDPERKELQASPQKVCGRVFGFIGISAPQHQARGAIHRHQAVTGGIGIRQFGSFEAVHVQKAGRVILEGARLFFGFGSQPMEAFSHQQASDQQAMSGGAPQMRQNALQDIEEIIEGKTAPAQR